MPVSDLEALSDEGLRRLQERFYEEVPGATHSEALTYEQAAGRLGVKYERVAILVSQGVLIAEKHPRDAKKYIGSDQIAWYARVRQGTSDLPNPARLGEEASRRSMLQAQSPAHDTLAELRRYVNAHMQSTDTAAQLNALLATIARSIAGDLVMESLPGEERESLAALLGAIIQKG
jgi:hypothetical protein